ncbi:MAG: DUF305 domain-containing protein [Candidatus Palauibacterales bacterium]|nr:DUF305 domain-containing protein [Candidatus Palauibacterales bacterium]MDP2528488.1 DUF305 domain-containing protein [Candidatus Palauibacterales bacterium]MDP2584043.1 DUF305 domain-containing protein [Candidatus Palauibacterales bacterium]
MLRPPRRLVAAFVSPVLALAGATGLLFAGATVVRAQQPSGNPADVQFMSGMIIHHEQAVLMAGWAPTHDAGPDVARLCRKISVSQRDDIDLMKRWLQEHGHSIPDTSWVFDYEGSGMRTHKLMAGMLTSDQLAALDAARGEEFDRLFLEGMIGHHAGAVTMVKDLLASPGGAQDNFVFEFATDINSSQTVEIHLMQRMLVALPADATKP